MLYKVENCVLENIVNDKISHYLAEYIKIVACGSYGKVYQYCTQLQCYLLWMEIEANHLVYKNIVYVLERAEVLASLLDFYIEECRILLI